MTNDQWPMTNDQGPNAEHFMRHLRSLYRYGVTGHLTDEQLLDRFVAHRDESGEEAFAELLEHHGPMVLGVCRRVLGNARKARMPSRPHFSCWHRPRRSYGASTW